MHTAPENSVIVFGVLQPDGTIRLDHPPAMSPGPIQITLRSVPPQRERLPDLSVEDPSVPAPFELPRGECTWKVEPIRVLQRLPDPFQNVEIA
jgi:hypothetical protein